MKKVNVGLIGYGTVGSGVIKLLNKRKNTFFYNRFLKDMDKRMRKNCPPACLTHGYVMEVTKSLKHILIN